MDADLERKLREMLDRQEIWSVMLQYARGIDRFDRALVRGCYHDDALDDHHSFVGSADAFIDWAFAFHGQFQTVHHHGLSNHFCEIEGDDAYSETYYTFIGANLAPPHLMSIGRYIDHLQRRNGGWKIASRVCTIEQNFDLSDNVGADVVADTSGLAPPLHAGRDKNDLSYLRPVTPRRPAVQIQ